jgi:hypothetical protein
VAANDKVEEEPVATGKQENLSIVIVVVEKRGEKNQALEEASGYEKKEIYGRNRWLDLIVVVTSMIRLMLMKKKSFFFVFTIS